MGIAQRSIRLNHTQKSRKDTRVKPLPVSIKTIGDWIQVKRREKNLTRFHLALKMGIATSLVCSWETIPATALADLNQYEAVVKLLVSGTNRDPFRAKMLPPLENRVGRRDKLIALSRGRFAMPRAKIEAKLRRWMSGMPDGKN